MEHALISATLHIIVSYEEIHPIPIAHKHERKRATNGNIARRTDGPARIESELKNK
jgi:hypothetical protein